MKLDNIGGRTAATVCTLALGLGGTSLLFGDVIFGAAEFTQKHFQTICIVIATTTAWMAVTHAGKSRHILACLGFLVLALAGSGVIVWNSLGRQTEGQMLSADDHDKAVATRGELTRKKADAEQTLARRQKEADAECKTGEGSKCRGARAVVTFWTDNVAGVQAQLDGLKVKPADASAEAFGNLVAAFSGDGTKAKALSMLVMPYIVTILFEFGFTMGLHYMFRPSRQPKQVVTVRHELSKGSEQTDFPELSNAELSELRRQFEPNGSPNRDGGPKVRRYSKDEAAADLVTRLALGERFGSQEQLKARYGVAKSTMSDWLREWERSGLVPARTQTGRCKALAK